MAKLMTKTSIVAIMLAVLIALAIPAYADDRDTAEVDDDSSESATSETQTATTSADASTSTETEMTSKRPAMAAKLKERMAAREAKIAKLETREARIETLKTEQAEVKSKLEGRKADLTSCKGKFTFDCKETRKEAKTDAIEHLSVTGERMLEQLGKAEEKVKASDLSEEQKAEALATIGTSTTEIQSVLEQLKALSETSDAGKVKELAKALKTAWQNAKVNMNHANGVLTTARVHGVTVKAENVEVRLQAQIDKLDAAGKDTTALKTKVAEFKTKVDSSKTKLEEAGKLYAGLSTSETKDADLAQAKTLHADAQALLKEAYAVLKSILEDLKAQAA